MGMHNKIGCGLAIGSYVGGPVFDWHILRDGMTPRRGSVAFTRASTGTFLEPGTALISTAAINAARVESDGLLIEASNTNYCLRSQELSHASWSRFGVLPVNAVTSPNGGTNAVRLIPTTANREHAITQVVAQNAVGTYCVSIYAKPAGYNWVLILTANTPGTSAVGGWFNIATGALGATTVVNGAIVSRENADAGNGWRRIKIRYTHTITTGNGIQLYATNANSVMNYTGNGTSGIDFYGAEIKPTSPDSYIPTVAASATRSADVCTLTVPAGVSSLGITYGDNTTATVSVTPGGSYQLPANTKKYKSIIAL